MSNKDIIYVVWYDNCQEYEDNYQDIQCICRTYEDAVKHIESMGYVKIKKKDAWAYYYGDEWKLYEKEEYEGEVFCVAEHEMRIRMFYINGKEFTRDEYGMNMQLQQKK